MIENKTDILLQKVKALKLYGVESHWDSVSQADWVADLVAWEEAEQNKRSLERRLSAACLGSFKSLAEFDWDWPAECDRQAIEACMALNFVSESSNIILYGPNGVGKSMIASNIAHQVVLKGHTALFITASKLLNMLSAQDGNGALQRRLKQVTKPSVLVIDEVGYLSYGNRHADLMFEVISRRYQNKSTIITTNKAFAEWGEIFPNASCVVSLIDRLVHRSEIINIIAESYRLKESKDRNTQRLKAREAGKDEKRKKTEEEKNK